MIVVICILVRIYKITSPVGDWHSWRQADTAAVARNFIKFGFDPLRPRYDDLSNIQSGKDNPNGWRMVEFPLYQILAYSGFKIIPQLNIEMWLRIVSIFASTILGIVIYKLVSIHSDRLTAIISFLIYGLLPYSIFYGRAILPETLMVFFAFLSLYMLTTAERSNRLNWTSIFLPGLIAGTALLVKPTGIFLLLPAVYLIERSKRSLVMKILLVIVYLLITVAPLLLWRNWILNFPEGIPAFDWLLNKDNIRLKGAWFYWLFADRIGRIITGYWGLIFLGIGFISPVTKREGRLYRYAAFGCLLYLIIFAGGNVQHDYYQILIVPVVSIYIAKGIVFMFRSAANDKLASYLMIVIGLFFMLAFSWYSIRTYYWINRRDLLEAGRYADSVLPAEAKVIAPNNGDTTFLYFINRQGWPIGFDIEKKISQGATHYVTIAINDLELDYLMKKYKLIVKNNY